MPPPRVEGEVFEISKSRIFLDLGKAALAFLFAAFLIWARGSSPAVGALSGGKAIAVWCVIVGLVLIGCGLLFIGLHNAGKQNSQLVLGADRLQIVDKRGVAIDIPYHNIAKAEYHPRKLLVAIELLDPEDRSTFDRSEKFIFMKKHFGWHFVINGNYQPSLPAIAEKIHDRLAQVR